MWQYGLGDLLSERFVHKNSYTYCFTQRLIVVHSIEPPCIGRQIGTYEVGDYSALRQAEIVWCCREDDQNAASSRYVIRT